MSFFTFYFGNNVKEMRYGGLVTYRAWTKTCSWMLTIFLDTAFSFSFSLSTRSINSRLAFSIAHCCPLLSTSRSESCIGGGSGRGWEWGRARRRRVRRVLGCPSLVLGLNESTTGRAIFFAFFLPFSFGLTSTYDF